MTNDYAALVAMLDQAAADLQAEIDAAIDRHGLLVRTADLLRGEAVDDTGGGILPHDPETCTVCNSVIPRPAPWPSAAYPVVPTTIPGLLA